MGEVWTEVTSEEGEEWQVLAAIHLCELLAF